MHNRLLLGCRDARLLDFLKGKTMRSIISIIGCYATYIGVCHFYYEALSFVTTPIETWYTAVETEVQEKIGQETLTCPHYLEKISPRYLGSIIYVLCLDYDYRVLYHFAMMLLSVGLFSFVRNSFLEALGA